MMSLLLLKCMNGIPALVLRPNYIMTLIKKLKLRHSIDNDTLIGLVIVFFLHIISRMHWKAHNIRDVHNIIMIGHLPNYLMQSAVSLRTETNEFPRLFWWWANMWVAILWTWHCVHLVNSSINICTCTNMTLCPMYYTCAVYRQTYKLASKLIRHIHIKVYTLFMC